MASRLMLLADSAELRYFAATLRLDLRAAGVEAASLRGCGGRRSAGDLRSIGGRRRVAGEPIGQLVVSEAIERSRHVVITTVTTITGFLPLALSPSLLWPPLAIAIIGGLTLATALTLVAIPTAYTILRPSS